MEFTVTKNMKQAIAPMPFTPKLAHVTEVSTYLSLVTISTKGDAQKIKQWRPYYFLRIKHHILDMST